MSVCVGFETDQIIGAPECRSAQATIPRPDRSPTHCLLDIASPMPHTVKPYDQPLLYVWDYLFRSALLVWYSAFYTYLDRFNLQAMPLFLLYLWYCAYSWTHYIPLYSFTRPFPSFWNSQNLTFIVCIEVWLFLSFNHYAHLLILCNWCVRYRTLGISLLAPVQVLKNLG